MSSESAKLRDSNLINRFMSRPGFVHPRPAGAFRAGGRVEQWLLRLSATAPLLAFWLCWRPSAVACAPPVALLLALLLSLLFSALLVMPSCCR